MTRITVKLTVKELELLSGLAADQLFRKEFIDPRLPGYKSNPGDLTLGKKLIERLRLLTDRANQAGGHDNITVVVATFDGSGLQPTGAEGDTPKYRKYVLPEEPADLTQPGRRLPAELDAKVTSTSDRPSGGGLRQGLSSTFVFSATDGQPSIPAALLPRPDKASPTPSEDEQIEIPGTHVPVWVVVLIVVAVIGVLTGTALLLLM